MRWAAIVLLLLIPIPAAAQQQEEGKFAADLRRERERIAKDCGDLDLKKVVLCGYALTTAYPFHLALGSLAPKNGFAFGLAFVERYTPSERWRLGWNADAVAAPSGSWRAGAYMRAVYTADEPVKPLKPGEKAKPVTIREHPVIGAHVQTTSLERIFFFGLGPDSGEADKAVYGMRQTIVGTNVIWPIGRAGFLRSLRPALIGGINGRFITLRSNVSEPEPSIYDLYDEGTAPGLTDQPTFTQFEEGIRFNPSTPGGFLRLNYLIHFQQYLGTDAGSSFRRWGVDLNHEFPIYRTVSSTGPSDANGPDQCFVSAGSDTCPEITFSRNRQGTVGFRVLATSATAFEGSTVPFYFQPTLGGSDINGQRLLASFDDYRFRGPKLVALQESVEHSIWGPLGIYFLAEQGKVAQRGDTLNFRDLTHSFAVGLTLRAGGMPAMTFSFAWGPEGNHTISTMDGSLGGGSRRPSLF